MTHINYIISWDFFLIGGMLHGDVLQEAEVPQFEDLAKAPNEI